MIFFHGNAEDIGIAYDVLQDMKTQLKLAIIAMEYPGYGLNCAPPSSDRLLEDALILYDHLTI